MKSPRTPKKKPEEIRRDPASPSGTPKELEMSTDDWHEFEHGVQLFNCGKFWNAHEAWEQVWLRHKEDERLFFQGLIQLAAAYHHLVQKKSVRGMLNNFEKAYAKLEVFRPQYLGVFVTPLLRCIEEARRAGSSPDFNAIPRLQFHKPYNPDLIVEVREFLQSERFREGLALFNKGYHWEAHEVWEDVWREKEGDAKLFAQAFVQLAAANSFVKLSKLGSARYLFEKSLEKFGEFEHLECGVDFPPLLENIRRVLEVELAGMGGGKNGSKPKGVPTIRLIPA
jgi:predicted metal-dependent hydrolase